MTIGCKWTVCLLATLLASACVPEIGEDTGEDLGEEGDAIDESGEELERWSPELPELTYSPEDVVEEGEADVVTTAATATHQWRLIILRGEMSSSANFGDGDAPDLYVKRFCGGAYRNKTAVQWNTRSPGWYTTLLSARTTDAYIKSCYFELWEADSNGHDYGGRVGISTKVSTMIANGSTRVSVPLWFLANDYVKVWVGLERL